MIEKIKITLATFCVLVIVIGVYDVVSPIPAGTRTTYPNVYYEGFSMTSNYEKILTIWLKNQTTYRFSLSANSEADVNAQVVITNFLEENISILDFRDHGGSISGEFVSNEVGNHTFHLSELNEFSEYTADFSVDEKIVEYYPGGGRYASQNKGAQMVGGTVKIVFGFAFLLVIFWSSLFKPKVK